MEWWLNAGFLPAEYLVPIARTAEEAGFTGVSMPDHLVYPEKLESTYPGSPDGRVTWSPASPWPDAWVAISAMAAATTRLRFTTAVYIAPLREPVGLAKAISTASALSGGRVECGFGTGWMREEFDLLHQGFADRGARLDELIQVLRLLWSGEMVSFSGAHYAFPRMQMSPAAAGPVPVLIGGYVRAARRRAARNDGWIGVYRGDLPAVRRELDELFALRRAAAPGGPFRALVITPPFLTQDAPALADAGAGGLIVPVRNLAGEQGLEGRLAAIRALAKAHGVGR